MVSGEGLREAVARAIYEARNGAGCKPWSLNTKQHKAPYQGDADAAIRAIVEASGLDAEALRGQADGLSEWPEHMALSDDAKTAALLRALAEAAEREGGG